MMVMTRTVPVGNISQSAEYFGTGRQRLNPTAVYTFENVVVVVFVVVVIIIVIIIINDMYCR